MYIYMDKLKELFNKQEILQERLGNIPFNDFKHKQVIRYDGTNPSEVYDSLSKIKEKVLKL